MRSEINPEAEIADGKTVEEVLNYSLEQASIKTGAKIVVVDNLTY